MKSREAAGVPEQSEGGAGVISILPWWAMRPLGAILGFVAGSILRIRRGHVDRSMDRIGARASATAMYRALGIGVFELLWLASASKKRRDAVLDRFVALDPLPDGAAVLGASHTGNWELAAAAVARKRSLYVVAKPFASTWFDSFVARLRARLGIETIDPRGAAKAVTHALRSGALVVMPLDQVPDRSSHAVTAPFLGAHAYVDRAPFVLARRARAKVVVCGAWRDGEVHRVRALGTAANAAEATEMLDGFVRAHPESWLWLHRRWRRPLVGAPPPRFSLRSSRAAPAADRDGPRAAPAAHALRAQARWARANARAARVGAGSSID